MSQLLIQRVVAGLGGLHWPAYRFAGGCLAGTDSSPRPWTRSRATGSGRGEADAGPVVAVRWGSSLPGSTGGFLRILQVLASQAATAIGRASSRSTVMA